MKKLLVVLSFLAVGMVSLVKAEDIPTGPGQGWSVKVVTGTTVIGAGRRVYVKAIVTSSAASADLGEYFMALTSAPALINGADGSLFGGDLFRSTGALIPPILFVSSTTANSGNASFNTQKSLNGMWSVGDCNSCWIEFPNGIYHRQTTQASGEARRVQYIYK